MSLLIQEKRGICHQYKQLQQTFLARWLLAAQRCGFDTTNMTIVTAVDISLGLKSPQDENHVNDELMLSISNLRGSAATIAAHRPFYYFHTNNLDCLNSIIKLRRKCNEFWTSSATSTDDTLVAINESHAYVINILVEMSAMVKLHIPPIITFSMFSDSLLKASEAHILFKDLQINKVDSTDQFAEDTEIEIARSCGESRDKHHTKSSQNIVLQQRPETDS